MPWLNLGPAPAVTRPTAFTQSVIKGEHPVIAREVDGRRRRQYLEVLYQCREALFNKLIEQCLFGPVLFRLICGTHKFVVTNARCKHAMRLQHFDSSVDHARRPA